MSNEERMKILSMLEEGKISAEEAAKLIDAVEPDPAQHVTVTARSGSAKLHVRVTDAMTEDTKVNFAVPLSLARFVASLVPERELAKLGDYGVDLDEIQEAIDTGAVGTVLEIDDDDGHHIVVWID